MDRLTSPVTVGAVALLMLAGCQSGTSSSSTPGPSTPQRGQLLTNPPTLVATFSTSDVLGLLGLDTLGQELLTLAYSPVCTVNIYQLNYETVGAKSESTTSTGALMVPSGSASGCQGPRPIVEYAHGTSSGGREVVLRRAGWLIRRRRASPPRLRTLGQDGFESVAMSARQIATGDSRSNPLFPPRGCDPRASGSGYKPRAATALSYCSGRT